MAVITCVIFRSHAEIKLYRTVGYISDSCMDGWVNRVAGWVTFLLYTNVGKITYLSPVSGQSKEIRSGFLLWYKNTHTRHLWTYFNCFWLKIGGNTWILVNTWLQEQAVVHMLQQLITNSHVKLPVAKMLLEENGSRINLILTCI